MRILQRSGLSIMEADGGLARDHRKAGPDIASGAVRAVEDQHRAAPVLCLRPVGSAAAAVDEVACRHIRIGNGGRAAYGQQRGGLAACIILSYLHRGAPVCAVRTLLRTAAEVIEAARLSHKAAGGIPADEGHTQRTRLALAG